MHFGLTGIAPTALYFGAVAAFFGSIFWRPALGIYFLVPLFPLQTIRLRAQDMPLGNKLIDLLLLGVLLGALFRPQFKFKTPLNVLLGIYTVYLYISLWSGSLYLHTNYPISIDDPRFSTWKNYVVMPLLFVLVTAVIRDVRQIRILLLCICISAFLADRSFYSNVGTRNLSHFSYDVRDGATFGYTGANGAAAFETEFGLFLLAIYAYEKNRYLKLLLLGMIAFSVYCLMYAFSRGAYVAFVVGVFYIALVNQRKLLILLVALAFTWQIVVPTAVQERIFMTYNNESGEDLNQELDASAADRVSLWQDAMDLIPTNPLLGTGFNTYAYMHRVSVYKDTHNYYLKVLVETGMIGLTLFLLVLFQMFRYPFKLFRTATDPFLKSVGLGLSAAVLGSVVLNLFGDRWSYIEYMGFMWTMLGCAVRGLELEREKKAQELQPAAVECAETGDVLKAGGVSYGVLKAKTS